MIRLWRRWRCHRGRHRWIRAGAPYQLACRHCHLSEFDAFLQDLRRTRPAAAAFEELRR